MRKVLAFIVILTMTLSLFVSTATPSSAACNKDNPATFSPTWGSVVTQTTSDGRSHQTTFSFRLQSGQVQNLHCIAHYLEIDFELQGSGLPGEWSNYKLETNLPGGIKDTPVQDTAPRPSVTNIHTNKLRANYTYYASIKWRYYVAATQRQYVRMLWTPSYWDDNWWSPQAWLCSAYDRDPRWCIFGVEKVATKMRRCYFPSSMGEG